MIEIYHNYQEHLSKLDDIQDDSDHQETVTLLQEMSAQIKRGGDQAVIDFCQKFDRIDPSSFSFWVTPKEIEAAYKQVPKAQLAALKKAQKNIQRFHALQLPKNWKKTFRDGTAYGMRFLPLEAVALYVPGGRAVYPSSVLMNAVPAQLAGVKRVVIATPSRPDGTVHPAILVAADLCGVKDILKVGGAQAVFALAYGTASIPAVHKIVGPGNRYVTLAKQLVASTGRLAIDKPAGPSEVALYCDQLQYASFAAAELLAQLEHDPDASAIAITPSEKIAKEIQVEFNKQVEFCKRKEIIIKSAKKSGVWVVGSEKEGIDALNQAASEHVVILTELEKAYALLDQVQHGSSVFLGPYTPVALGDYWAGPNHVLPTNKGARFSSPLGVMDFMKFSSFLSYSKSALQKTRTSMKQLTQMEGLDAHGRSVEERLIN